MTQRQLINWGSVGGGKKDTWVLLMGQGAAYATLDWRTKFGTPSKQG